MVTEFTLNPFAARSFGQERSADSEISASYLLIARIKKKYIGSKPDSTSFEQGVIVKNDAPIVISSIIDRGGVE